MLTLSVSLESLLCLQQALIRRLPLHHTCLMKISSPHTAGDTALPAESAPTGGVNGTGATCQPPQLNWTEVGNQSPLPQQLPAHEDTQTWDLQWHRDSTSWGWQKAICRVQKNKESHPEYRSQWGEFREHRREHPLKDNRARVSLITELSQGLNERKIRAIFPSLLHRITNVFKKMNCEMMHVKNILLHHGWWW